jgi:N-acetylmuramic acid 6-phosphate etherase
MTLHAMPTRDIVALMNDDLLDVHRALNVAQPEITAFIDALVLRIREGGRLMYLGAGTSGRLGVLDASECPPTFQSDPGQIIGIIAGGDSALRRSSEHKEDDPDGARDAFDAYNLCELDTVLGIAAGGTTPFVIGGLEIAHVAGAMTGLLACATGGAISPAIDHRIEVLTGPEVLTGSTRLKAGTATKLVLNTITTTLFVELGSVYENLMVDLRVTNDKLHDRALRILMTLCPRIDRIEAGRILDEAQGDVKVAIVTIKRGIPATVARSLLDSADGRLETIV